MTVEDDNTYQKAMARMIEYNNSHGNQEFRPVVYPPNLSAANQDVPIVYPPDMPGEAEQRK